MSNVQNQKQKFFSFSPENCFSTIIKRIKREQTYPFLKMLPLHTARQSNSLAAVVVPCHKGWHGSPSRLCSFGQKAGFSACVFVCGRVDWRCWPVSAVLAHPSPGPCCSCCYFCCFNPDVFQNPLRLEGRLAGWQHCCLRLSHL